MKKIKLSLLSMPIDLLSGIMYDPQHPFGGLRTRRLCFSVLDQETTKLFGDGLGSAIRKTFERVKQSTHNDLFRKWWMDGGSFSIGN